MNKRQVTYALILTIVVAGFLSVLIITTINDVNRQVKQDSFDKLENASKDLAEEIKRMADSDRTILTAMSAIISGLESPSDEKVSEILNTYQFDASYLSYTEILRPDNTMLYSDASVRDVSDTLRFSEEAATGGYISNLTQSTRDTDDMVIRNAVPVIQNGKTIYMLYGVTRHSDLAEEYQANIYEGRAQVFIVDADTGDFLLDTWHRTLGNIEDFASRQLEPGYSWDAFLDDLRAGISGRLALTSDTIGEIIYLRYDPTGVNNWNIMVMTSQAVALRESEAISNRLYGMATIIGAVMLLYMLGVTWSLFRAYRKVRKLSNEDPTTGLQNRNAFEKSIADIRRKSFDSLSCVFIDVNGLHEMNKEYGHKAGDRMLQTVADALLQEFTSEQVFRIGGDEFVVLSMDSTMNECALKMERVTQRITSLDYSIAYGIAHRENGIGADSIVQEADRKMLENKRAYYAGQKRSSGLDSASRTIS